MSEAVLMRLSKLIAKIKQPLLCNDYNKNMNTKGFSVSLCFFVAHTLAAYSAMTAASLRSIL